MNFPLILSISSLAVGGITFATIQSSEPVGASAETPAIVRPLTAREVATPAPEPLASHAACELDGQAIPAGSEGRLTALESRIAELEAENARLRAGSPLGRPVAGELSEDHVGQLMDALTSAAQAGNVACFGQDPAKILGLTTPAQRERFNEILAAFGQRYHEVLKLNTREDAESSNETLTVKVIEPFPEEGARLREDLKYELSALNGDPDKVDEALNALGPRYNNWGKTESRMMTMSGEAFGLKGGSGTDAKVQMMFQQSEDLPLKMPGGDLSK